MKTFLLICLLGGLIATPFYLTRNRHQTYHGVIVRVEYLQHAFDSRWLVTTDQGYSCTFYVRHQPGLAVGDSIYGSGVRNARPQP